MRPHRASLASRSSNPRPPTDTHNNAVQEQTPTRLPMTAAASAAAAGPPPPGGGVGSDRGASPVDVQQEYGTPTGPQGQRVAFTNHFTPSSQQAHRPASRRSLREEFHSRSKQLVTSQPRLVSAVYLDSQWTMTLSSSCVHVLLNPQRWACTRCAVIQQAFAIDAANRIQWKRSGDEFFVHQGPPEVVHDQSIDGTTIGESCCCGWTLVPQGSNTATTSATMRAFGCEWTQHSILACIILTDLLTLGLPCTPCGYLGCGSLWVGLQTRLLIRRKYRVVGFGVHDCCTLACCPQCAVEQQMSEMIRQGVLITSPSPCEMC